METDIFMYDDEQVLRKLYIDERKSSWDIAAQFGVSQSTIIRQLRKFNIPRRTYHENPCPTRGKHLSKEHRKKIAIGNTGLCRIDAETGRGYNCRKITVYCKQCNLEMLRPPRFANKNVFCSSKCSGIFNGHKQKKRTIIKCSECGKELSRCPSGIGKNNFCSQSCAGEWKSKNLTGDKIYNFKGGYDRWSNYGPSWPYAKRQARIRDDHTCQICGIKKSQLKKNLDTHHLLGFRHYGLEKHQLANDLNNLISLCPKCHTIMESETVSVLDKMSDEHIKALFCH